MAGGTLARGAVTQTAPVRQAPLQRPCPAMVPDTRKTSRSPSRSPSRRPPPDERARDSASRITQAYLDPSDHRTIACVAIVLGPPDDGANRCLSSLQAALDERVQVVKLGTEDDRLQHMQRTLLRHVGPGTVALVIQCGTGGQEHPDLAGLKDTLDGLARETGGSGLTAPVVVCSAEQLRDDACIAQLIAQHGQIEGLVGPSKASRPPEPQAPDTPPAVLAHLPWHTLVSGPPVGMVFVKIGCLDERDADLVDELTYPLVHTPLVWVQFGTTFAALERLAQLHANRGTPQTQYVILCDPAFGTEARVLFAAMAKQKIAVRMYSHDDDDDGGRSMLRALAARVAIGYEDALNTHDQRYLDKLKAWASGPDKHQGDPTALYEYLVQVLDRSRSDVFADIDLRLEDPDLLHLPPLPPRTVGRLELIDCSIERIRGLPVTLRQLTISHADMLTVDIDPAEVPQLEWVDLRGLRLRRAPHWVDELPDGVQVLMPDTSSEDESHGVDPESDDDASPPPLSDDEAEPGAGPIAEALRLWSDTPASHLLEQDWQRLESLPGADGLARLLVKLGTDQRFASLAQGARIANLLSAMRKDLALARLVMEVAAGADDSCIDRASLTWHFIELACESHALLQRRPLRLPELLDHARQVLRRSLLLNRANEKITQLRRLCVSLGKDPDDVDEIEVVLAFFEWGQGALQIRKNPYARFTRTAISGVEMREVSVAVRDIRAFEDAQFEVFLTDWTPWRDVLSALKPERMEAIALACSDIDGIDAAARRELAQQGVPNADTAIVSSEDRTRISNAIRREGVIRLTHDVLEEHRHANLLGPFWALQ